MKINKLNRTITLTEAETHSVEHDVNAQQRLHARARDIADWSGLDCTVYALRNGALVPVHVATYPA